MNGDGGEEQKRARVIVHMDDEFPLLYRHPWGQSDDAFFYDDGVFFRYGVFVCSAGWLAVCLLGSTNLAIYASARGIRHHGRCVDRQKKSNVVFSSVASLWLVYSCSEWCDE